MPVVLELDDNDILNLLTKIKNIHLTPNTSEETITIEKVKSNRKGRCKMTPEERVEKLNNYSREYYKKNREMCLEKQKKYHDDNHREFMYEYYHKNKEKYQSKRKNIEKEIKKY